MTIKWSLFKIITLQHSSPITGSIPMDPKHIVIGLAPIMQLGTCVIKILTFKGGHLMW